MKKDVLDRYNRNEDGSLIIEITTDRIEDLYNYFDKSAPYHKKELDPELAEYLISSVSEIGHEKFIIHFRISSQTDSGLTERLQKSIMNYFIYLKELELREMAGKIRSSLIFLLIGISIMTISIWLNRHMTGNEGFAYTIFAEGLTVASWISLWEALATFLINWRPHRKSIKLFELLAGSRIILSGDVPDKTRGYPD